MSAFALVTRLSCVPASAVGVQIATDEDGVQDVLSPRADPRDPPASGHVGPASGGRLLPAPAAALPPRRGREDRPQPAGQHASNERVLYRSPAVRTPEADRTAPTAQCVRSPITNAFSATLNLRITA